jgi:hypothetical protein
LCGDGTTTGGYRHVIGIIDIIDIDIDVWAAAVGSVAVAVDIKLLYIYVCIAMVSSVVCGSWAGRACKCAGRDACNGALHARSLSLSTDPAASLV